MASDLKGDSTPPTEVKHTPLPWELHGDGSLRVCRPHPLDPKGCRPVAEAEILGQLRPEAEANAAFIVRAVNNHEALLAALERIRDELGVPQPGYPAPVTNAAEIACAAIAQAREVAS